MRTETFSYLPLLTQNEIAKQIQYIINQGWTAGIEYSTDTDPKNSYWNFWKLPFFGEKNVAEIMAEMEACRQANPEAYIRIIGYDNIRQGQVHSFVALEPESKSS